MPRLSMEEFWEEAGKSRKKVEKYMTKRFHLPRDKAEDIASEAITKEAYYQKKGAGFKGKGELSAWLIVSARRLYISELRKTENRVVTVPIECIEAEKISTSPMQYITIKKQSLNEDLRSAVRKLPESQRKVLEFELADLRQMEIARALGIEIGTVKSNKFLAIKNLRRQCPQLSHYLQPGIGA